MIQKIIARAFIGCFLGFLSFSSFAAQKDLFEVDPNELYGHPRGVLLRDVYLYYWKGIAASSHLERSSDMLAEGEVVIVSKPQRTPRDPDYHKNYFRVDGWAPDHAYKSGAVPRDAVRVLTASELSAIREKRYPTVNRKGRAVGRSLLYVLPERGAGQPRGGGINEKRTPELDVLRRTADGEWYQVRYRSQAYNVDLGGWVPARTVALEPTADERAIAEQKQAIAKKREDEIRRQKCREGSIENLPGYRVKRNNEIWRTRSQVQYFISPHLECKSAATIPAGRNVAYVGYAGRFYKVVYYDNGNNKRTGYVSKDQWGKRLQLVAKLPKNIQWSWQDKFLSGEIHKPEAGYKTKIKVRTRLLESPDIHAVYSKGHYGVLEQGVAVTVIGALSEHALIQQVQGGPFGWVLHSSLAQPALARAPPQGGGQVGPVASSQDYWLYIAGYLTYFVLILAIPGSRYYLLEKNLAFGRYAFFILKQVFNPYFLLCVAILTGVIIGSYFLISRGTDWLDYLVHQKLNELPLLGKLALFAVLAAIVIGLLYVLGFLLVIFGVLYVVLLVLDLLIDLAVMLVTAVVLIFLPGFILMMMQLVHYLFVRHPAEAILYQSMRKQKVDPDDAKRLASKMHNPASGSLWSWFKTQSYIWSLDKMREVMNAETAVMNDFVEYSLTKHRFNRELKR